MTKEERDEILNRRMPDSEVAKRIEEINTHDPACTREDPFLLWLEEDIHDGKNLLQSAKSEEERSHITSAISTLYDVKEKYLSLKHN